MTKLDAEKIVATLTLAQKACLMAGKDIWNTLDLPEIGLTSMKMADGPMGITGGRVDERDISLLSPCGTALAASWDTAIFESIGKLIAEEAKARGVQVVLGPNINMPRSPLAGRNFETYAEDPFLTGTLGVAWIAGMQREGVAATAKHLVANDSETDRNTMNSVVDERALREVYLLPFEMAASSGVWAMLTAYNRVNGVHAVENDFLLSRVLREDWQYDGVVMSDWFGSLNTLASANAGLDLEMPGAPRIYGENLQQAVERGQVAVEVLDRACSRILQLAARVGKLGAQSNAAKPNSVSLARQQEVLLQAAAAGFVLLKNAGQVLPLKPSALSRIAVIGPNAFVPCYQGGTFGRIALASSVETPVESLTRIFGAHGEVLSERGVPTDYLRPPFEALEIHPPDDHEARGFAVEFFGDHDLHTPLAREVRNTSSLVWFGAMPGIGPLDRAGGLRASAIFTPEADGEYAFYIGGTGQVQLQLDGANVAQWDGLKTAADLMGALKRGDSTTHLATLQAGVAVRIDIELRFQPGRAQGLWMGCRPPAAHGDFESAVTAASKADAVILIVGETQESALESVDRTTTFLPDNQIRLIEAITAANPKTILVLNVAHAVDLSCASHAAAILMAWFPGQQFGPALAATLAGKLEPGGRLPVTFAKSEQDYPAFLTATDAAKDLVYSDSNLIGYRHFIQNQIAAAYPFGFGLGYTAFTLTDFSFQPHHDPGVITLQVTNTGQRPGKQVVQVYVAGPEVPYSLQGFAVAHVAAGESTTVSIRMHPRAFSHWSVQAQGWKSTPGDYRVSVGVSCEDISFTTQVTVDEDGKVSASV